MHAECPSCKTRFYIEKILPGMTNGVITCAICHQHFEVIKTKRFLLPIKIETRLRQHQNLDVVNNLKHEING